MREYLRSRIKAGNALHMVLIDPARTSGEEAGVIAEEAERAGSAAVMVGGSVGVSEKMVDEVVLSLKKRCSLPVILFPGNPSGVSRYADAVWFLSVLNSSNPFFIVGGQAQAAPIVKKYGLEPLPLAYLILGKGGAVSYISYTRPLPFDKPELVVSYALAAKYFGFQYVYLEGGSGGDPIPPHIISAVKQAVGLPLIVGGGIRTPELAYTAVKAGADIIVTGTVVEEEGDVYAKLKPIVEAINKAARERKAQGEP